MTQQDPTGVVTASHHVRLLAAGLRFPEGPVAMADASVLVCELGGGQLTRVMPDGGKSVTARLGGSPNGAALGPDGRCYVCNSGGFSWFERDGLLMPGPPAAGQGAGSIQAVDLTNGTFETLYESAGDVLLRGPNDIVFDADGGFWFTDHGKFQKRSRDRGSVFYALPNGSSIRECISGLEGPNGIGLSPDGSRLYVAETLTARLWSYDLAAPGKLARNPTTFDGRRGTLITGLGGYCLFDSLAMDVDGNICVATLPGAVNVISPEGRLLDTLRCDDDFVTNICFGGPENDIAYVTLSSTGGLAVVEGFRKGLLLHFTGAHASAPDAGHGP
ncbi:MAG: SMP-30/gluconolactonase/LRE family protein [Sulfuricaulis sp.]|nr:SMP-30/gluconolactonase/LRE family protein [Sulfuricaulis sp.]